MQRRPPHGQHPGPARAGLRRLRVAGRLHARDAVHDVQRSGCRLRRPRDLLQLERRLADDRRRHRQAESGADLAQHVRGLGLHAPGLADRGSALLPGQRRARRVQPGPQQLDVHLGHGRPRRAGAHGALRQPDHGHRPQPLRSRRLPLRLQLPGRPADHRHERRLGRRTSPRPASSTSIPRTTCPTSTPTGTTTRSFRAAT